MSGGAPVRLCSPSLEGGHYRKVTKAVSYLSPKGEGGQEHDTSKAKRERHLYRVRQLGHIWQELDCSNPSCAILHEFQVNALTGRRMLYDLLESPGCSSQAVWKRSLQATCNEQGTQRTGCLRVEKLENKETPGLPKRRESHGSRAVIVVKRLG
jgi:hypothetical protein